MTSERNSESIFSPPEIFKSGNVISDAAINTTIAMPIIQKMSGLTSDTDKELKSATLPMMKPTISGESVAPMDEAAPPRFMRVLPPEGSPAATMTGLTTT